MPAHPNAGPPPTQTASTPPGLPIPPGSSTTAAPRPRPHLRLLPAPMQTPQPLSRTSRGPGPGQAALDLEFTVGHGLPAEPALPRRLMLVTEDDFGRRPTPRQALPPAGMWVARLAVALVEALHGQRPSSQLVRWTTQEVLTGLRRQSASRAHHPSAITSLRAGGPERRARYTVSSMRVEEPADGVVEATVLLTGPGRPIPLAMRLEGLDGRWICTIADTPDARITGTAPTFGQRCYQDGA
jgi:hypothetical protein